LLDLFIFSTSVEATEEQPEKIVETNKEDMTKAENLVIVFCDILTRKL
jgi:hypothetical protein